MPDRIKVQYEKGVPVSVHGTYRRAGRKFEFFSKPQGKERAKPIILRQLAALEERLSEGDV